MIQAITDDDQRSTLGIHYTSVPNILKVLNPLFLDNLREKLAEAGDNGRKLLNLRNRMARIRVFDPACGSGNFLVIAYKSLREIEFAINKARSEPDRRSDIPLTNFRGIELRDFPAEIARLALIIAEYQCDVTYRGQQEAIAEFLPLDSENWIICGNALRLDWLSILDVRGTGVKIAADDFFEARSDQTEIGFQNQVGETYICGNPPYLGSKRQTEIHKADLKRIFEGHIPGWRSLDYVAAWFAKAADFGLYSPAATAFVATNSICQGQQVSLLWKHLLSRGVEITFAHTSFKWRNLASKNAGVTVVIVGISNSAANKQIFDESSDSKSTVRHVDHINPYLVAAPSIIVEGHRHHISGLPAVDRGNSPTDGGYLILERHQSTSLSLPKAAHHKFIRAFVGSAEVIRGSRRYCIWINDDDVEEACSFSDIKDRIEQVRAFRLKSSKAATVKAANWSYRFDERKPLPESPAICVPITSSEEREYLPVDLLPAKTVVSNLAFSMPATDVWTLSVLGSRLLRTWVATVCSRLELRFRFTNTLGWNTFPVPSLTEKNKADLTRCAENILLAREAHYPATIADLYDPKKMPDDLRT